MPNNQTLSAARQPALDTADDGPRAALLPEPQPSSLAAFEANPYLFIEKLVTKMNRNAGAEPAIRPDLAAALDQAADRATVGQQRTNEGAVCRPRALAGSVVIKRNRSSTVRNRTLSFAPTAADMAALRAGEHLAHDLIASGMPATLAAQADAIAHYADPIYKAYEVRRLERRGVQVAEAAARHYINHCQPAALDFARSTHLHRWYAEQFDLTGAEMDLEVRDAIAARLWRRTRLAWAHPSGPEHGMLLDRFHHTHQRGAIERDTWIRRKVAEDLASIDMFLAPAYANGTTQAPGLANLGVRVHAHRAPNTGIHFLPDYAGSDGEPLLGDHHRIGECDNCVSRTTLPNIQSNTQSTKHVLVSAGTEA